MGLDRPHHDLSSLPGSDVISGSSCYTRASGAAILDMVVVVVSSVGCDRLVFVWLDLAIRCLVLASEERLPVKTVPDLGHGGR
jgi:hypothetical protein